jgi:hypothetical protein
LLGFVACWLAFGPAFFTGLLAPRLWSGAFVYPKLAAWLPPLLPLVAVGLLLLTRMRRTPFGTLLGLYVTVALLAGCVGLAGDGVVYNALFDLAIAAALAVGYLIGQPVSHARLTHLATLTAVALLTWSAAVSATSLVLHADAWFARERQQVQQAQRMVATISERTGHVLCEDLLLCYWAGQPFEVDAFNYQQSVRLGRRDLQPLLDEIAHQGFAAIELSQIDHRLLPSIREAIYRNYAPMPGLPGLLLPRGSDHAAMTGRAQ